MSDHEKEQLHANTPLYLPTAELEPHIRALERTLADPADELRPDRLATVIGKQNMRCWRLAIRGSGLLQFVVADRISCAIGLHPIQVWGARRYDNPMHLHSAGKVTTKEYTIRDIVKQRAKKVGKRMRQREDAVFVIQQTFKALEQQDHPINVHGFLWDYLIEIDEVPEEEAA